MSGTAAGLLPRAAGQPIALAGQLSGNYEAVPTSSAPGVVYTVFTSGKLNPIERTGSVTGSLRIFSNISGPPSGALKLVNSWGTLTIEIPKSVLIPTGVPTSTVPNQIFDTYTITKASGSYKAVTGFGVVEFDFLSSQPIGAEPVRTGRVVLTFSPLASSPMS